VNDDDLKKFAKAQHAMSKVRQEIAEAESPEESRALRQEVAAKLESVIRAYGLSVERYNRIAERLRADRSLMERFEKILRETAPE